MTRKTLISLAVIAALGGTATISATETRNDAIAVVADSAQKKQAVAAPDTKSKLAETKKAVEETHKAAKQRRLAQKQSKQAMAANGNVNGNEEVVAYSDTTTAVAADDAANGDASYSNGNGVDETNRYNIGRFKDPFSWFSFMATTGFGGILIALLCILMVFLFLIMPFIVLFMILRYITHRHNDRVKLAEMAVKQGRPINEKQMEMMQEPRSYQWRRGVKQLSLGLGLMLLFLFMGANELAGIGALVACLGAGKMFMARYDYNLRRRYDTAGDSYKPDDTAPEPLAQDVEKADDAETVTE